MNTTDITDERLNDAINYAESLMIPDDGMNQILLQKTLEIEGLSTSDCLRDS